MKDSRYTIRPLDNKGIAQGHRVLPRHSFTMGIIGSRGQGKTTNLINLLTRAEFYRDEFDDCYVFCPTFLNDEKYQILLRTNFLKEQPKTARFDIEGTQPKRSLNEANVFTEMTSFDNHLLAIREMQTRVTKKDKPRKILIVIDDAMGQFLKSNVLRNYICNSRHLNTSLIISVQSYFSMVKTIRLNMAYWIIYPLANRKEQHAIWEENAGTLDWQDFESEFKAVCIQDHGFLCINNQNRPKWRFIDTFREFIVTE